MNDEKFTAVMGVLVEQVVHLITENYEYDELTASNVFYKPLQMYFIIQRFTPFWNRKKQNYGISVHLPFSICLMRNKRQVVLLCRRRFDNEQPGKIYDILCRTI